MIRGHIYPREPLEGENLAFKLFIPILVRFKMTLNYRVIVDRYPFSDGVVGGSILLVKFSLHLTEEIG